MKYLGIDFGSKRVGVAVSDDDGKMAFPYSVISNSEKLLKEIKEIIKKEKIEQIIIGESKNFQGEPNKIQASVEDFKKKLEEKLNIKVWFEPEFMTSSQAEHVQGKTEMHDASAAAIILQSFLDKNQHVI
ncbi:MAG: Holliday junction resolvase RuvX [Patescibacteria group bacterium]